MEEMLFDVESKEIRLAELKHGRLVNFQIERKNARELTGNIYRGRVTNILKNIQSAFIDIGEGDNGFIHISDILENTKKFEQQFDMDFELEHDLENYSASHSSPSHADISELLKEDQPVLVQVVKEPIGTKGARLTSNVSVAGRYLVLLPNSSHRGVSKKIEERHERDRLKKIIRSFEMPNNMGLICRTASALAPQDVLIDEAQELFDTWQQITENFNSTSNPKLLFAESDLIKRAVIRAVDKKFDRLLIDDYQTFQACKRLYRRYASQHSLKIDLYRDRTPIFERFNVERELERSLRRKVWLPSGVYLFFEKTEAMTTIDVNSGRSNLNSVNVEESLVQINIEAAEEIARQLKIRNIGGLIIIDFIDMRYRKNQRRVLDRLKECMKEDPAKSMFLNISELGLVEMTRQRSRGSLLQTMFSPCPYCSGSGLVESFETSSIQIERALKKIIQNQKQYALKLLVHPQLYEYMKPQDLPFLEQLADKFNARITVETHDALHVSEFTFFSSITQQQLVF